MHSVKINDKLSIAGQPSLSDFAGFAAEGVTRVINNRPDGEEPSQPSAAAETTASETAGMDYVHIPVTGPTMSEADVRAFQDAIRSAPGPVLAHCRSGTRCMTLWAIGEVLDGRLAPGDVVVEGARLGFDLRGAEAWLQRNGKAG